MFVLRGIVFMHRYNVVSDDRIFFMNILKLFFVELRWEKNLTLNLEFFERNNLVKLFVSIYIIIAVVSW